MGAPAGAGPRWTPGHDLGLLRAGTRREDVGHGSLGQGEEGEEGRGRGTSGDVLCVFFFCGG